MCSQHPHRLQWKWVWSAQSSLDSISLMLPILLCLSIAFIHTDPFKHFWKRARLRPWGGVLSTGILRTALIWSLTSSQGYGWCSVLPWDWEKTGVKAKGMSKSYTKARAEIMFKILAHFQEVVLWQVDVSSGRVWAPLRVIPSQPALAHRNNYILKYPC